MRPKTKYFLLVALLVLGLGLALRGAISQVASGTWAPAASMAQARSGASAALLQAGPILITGGDGANGPLADAELFGTDGTFSAAAPMNVARSRHISAVLQDGRVLVAGGTTTGGGATNAAEIYDPIANSWTSVAGGMVEARAGHTASVLADGRVLIAGGENAGVASATLEIFDPVTNAFSFAGVLSSPRKNHAAAVLADGRVLIVGGSDGKTPLASSDIYDPSIGTVSAGPVLSTPRQGLSATTQLDGKVVVIGGNTVDAVGASVDLASAEVYDPAAQPPASFAALSSALTTPRQGHLAFLLPHNNNVLIVGGTSAGTALASAELFTPWQGTFSSTGALSAVRSSATGSALSLDGLLLVAGGKDASGTALASTALYGFATVKTDKADYAPGEIVTITGSGWQPGESVTLNIHEIPFINNDKTFVATADAFGNIFNNSYSPEPTDVGFRYYLTASGASSQAQTTFADAPAASSGDGSMSVSPTSVTAGSTGNTLTFTFTGRSGRTFAAGSIVTVTIPTGANLWSTPQTGNPAGTGYVSGQANVSGATCNPGAPSVSGSVITIPQTCDGSNSFKFTYSNATAQTASGTATFAAASRNGGSGSAVSLGSGNPTVTVNAAAANKLAFSVQPSNAAVGQTITPAVKVQILDQFGNLTTSTASVALAISNNPSGGTLAGDGGTPAVAGTATFSSLSIDKAGNGYTLAASSTGLAGATSNGFNITTVTPAFTNLSSPSITYGTPSTTLSGTISSGSLIPSGSVSITLNGVTQTAAINSTTGNFSSSFTTSSLTVTNSPYTITYSYPGDSNFTNVSDTSKSVTVTKATPTVVDISSLNPSTYGQSVTFTATVTNPNNSAAVTEGCVAFVDNTTSTNLTGAIALNGSGQASFSTSTLTAGSHDIQANYNDSGGGCSNSGTSFNNSHGNVTQTVNKAMLTVTADNKTKVYAAALPTLTASYTGFVNGDTLASAVTGSPTLTTTATASSHVAGNPYSITVAQGTLAAANYTFTFVNGQLTVTPAPLTITADSKTKAYGAPLPTLTVTYTGLVNGDTPATFSAAPNTPPTVTSSGSASSHVAGSPYSITPSGAVDSDYSISYVAGTLMVTPAPLTITADNQTKVYGAPLPTLTVTYTGLVNGDTPATFSAAPNTAPTVTTTATASSHVSGSPYSITASGAVDSDYSISYVAGTLTVTPAHLTITADNKTMILNGPFPLFTVAYTGFVLGEGPGVLSGTLSCTTTATGTAVGSYPINCSGQSSSNYVITYVPGTLQVLYSTGPCLGSPGHAILQPIDFTGASVFPKKQGSTVPAKFRVCDALGNSIGASTMVVTDFKIVQILYGTVVQTVNEDPVSTTPDAAFRWDASGMQWIYNISTKPLDAGKTYYFQITLNDGTMVNFNFGLK